MDDEKNVMQTCYRVGRLALLNGEYHIAAKWLGRAMDSGDALCGQTDSALRDTRLCVLNAAGTVPI